MDEPTLAELFARDPLTLTREDLDRIIEKLRESRKNFVLGGKTAVKGEKKPVDLKELGLL